jgi:hypothetical protein
MLCLCDISLNRTEFRAAYLRLLGSRFFEPDLVRAEINNAGAPRPVAAADQADRPRSFEEARRYSAQSAVSAATSAGTWRLVRTPNPRGGPDAVSTADGRRHPLKY